MLKLGHRLLRAYGPSAVFDAFGLKVCADLTCVSPSDLHTEYITLERTQRLSKMGTITLALIHSRDDVLRVSLHNKTHNVLYIHTSWLDYKQIMLPCKRAEP